MGGVGGGSPRKSEASMTFPHLVFMHQFVPFPHQLMLEISIYVKEFRCKVAIEHMLQCNAV